MEILKGEQVPIYTWAPIHSIESEAIDQLKSVAALPWVYDHVAVMPDVHAGKGATIGTVIASLNSLMPSAVGVDIACGMNAYKVSINVDSLKDLHAVREAIEAKVPVGFKSHETPVKKISKEDFFFLPKDLQDKHDTAERQIGTLGGGNHFIEISVDENNDVWVMLHSGSRNIGKTIADYHINIAKSLPENAHYGDLARLIVGTDEFENYWHDLQWAQRYATLNREWIARLVFDALDECIGGSIGYNYHTSCHHNFVERTNNGVFITRKGAIAAYDNERGIIPGSMGTASFITIGHSNENAWFSASHGAGRKMSRGQAKRTFTEEDAEKQLRGIESKKDKTVLDELPGAYKDINDVMEQQAELVSPIFTLHQLISIKG